MKETQLTNTPYGHTLNSTQVFSPDDRWIFYDTRNEDTHIARTGSIEKVNVVTGEIAGVYRTQNQTASGPGVGAVACHPVENKIIFIHGLLNSSAERPYGFTRRFGAIVDDGHPGFFHAEARVVREPLIAGALRGGTHAHSWSGDGQWISFTYNDFLMEVLEKQGEGVKDLRTIGVMAPVTSVTVKSEDDENFSGAYFSVVAATVTENPPPGTDEISRAFDECWIGGSGYVKPDGAVQRRAIAFQGNVVTPDGTVVTEVFVADLPEQLRAADGKPLQGTPVTRPNVPAGLHQRRVTFLSSRKYPGIQGPRTRLRTAPDGSSIYFLAKDDNEVVQVFSVPTLGGSIRQVTALEHSVQAQFNVSPDGRKLSVISDNSVWMVDVSGGVATRLTERSSDEDAPVGGALWSHDGKVLVFNRYAGGHSGRYLQIFKLENSGL